MKRKSLLVAFLAVFVFSVSTTLAFAEPIKWKYITTWPTGVELIKIDQDLAKMINLLCKGELEVKLFAAGEIVPGNQVFDTVQSGTVQIGGDWPGYWAGKNTAFNVLGSLPLGLNFMDYYSWVYSGGGEEIAQEIYGKYGLVYFATVLNGTESGLRGKKAFKKMSDFKGAKVRMSGLLQGEILKAMGASQVNISPTEIYQALEKGIIDAAEYSMPDSDWKLGLQEVTKIWNAPGWHQIASMGGIMINKKAWDSLPKHVQDKIKIACKASFAINFPRYDYDAAVATEKFKNKKGQSVVEMEPASLIEMQKIAFKAFEAEAQKNPLFAKAVYSQYKTKQTLMNWRDRQKNVYRMPTNTLPNMDLLKKAAEKAH